MLRKSLKYLVIIALNAVLLLILILVSSDRLFRLLNPGYIRFELLKIGGISVVIVLIIGLATAVFKDRGITTKKQKLIATAVLSVLISSLFYMDYVPRVVTRFTQNNALRHTVVNKIKRSQLYPYGLEIKQLSHAQYTAMTNSKWFPKIQAQATNIDVSYTYDGFLPDYSFNLKYSLPLGVKIDSSQLSYGTIKIDTIGQLQQIGYNEYVD